MSKIICVLANASDLINGIKFTPVEGVEGLVSEEVSESVAALFLSIPGYVLHGAEGEDGNNGDDGEKNPPPPAPKQETATERKARLKREAAEKEAADKAEAERKAAEEEAARKAEEEAARQAEEEAARKAAEDAANAGTGEGDSNEVF